jgi:signal transduction histidine kinase
MTRPGDPEPREQARLREIAILHDASRVLPSVLSVANLLDNAVKYSPRGGAVRCTIRREAGRVLVEVSDGGLGIAVADMDTLFTRFGRIETAENRDIQGTGLGLYLSRELAQMHGGSLTARSEAGVGSTFTLAVPLAGPTR